MEQEKKTVKERLEAIENQVFNHIPSRLAWQDKKLDFIIVFLMLLMALIGVIIFLVV